MLLDDGLHDVPPGHLANVVTVLEMTAPPEIRETGLPKGAQLVRVDSPGLDWYRDLFERVGGQDWLWESRLGLSDDALSAILDDNAVEVMSLTAEGTDQGIVELDFREQGACELMFFGVTRAMIGKGAGRYMMNAAIRRAFERPIDRFHVHTCTFDHPRALDFYRRSGFTPVRQQIEVMRDPRLTGLLPRDAGPHIPVFPESS